MSEPIEDGSSVAADVLILGGGAIGLACALALLASGRSVRVIERGRTGAAASHGNCGTLTPSHALPLNSPATLLKAVRGMLRPDAPFYLKPRWDPALWRWLLQFASHCTTRHGRHAAQARAALLLHSRALIEQWIEQYALDCEFSDAGLHEVYRDPRAFAADCAELPVLAEYGIAATILDAQTLAADEPALKPGMAGAIHFPGDAQLRPDAYCAGLARCVRAAGGVIEEGVEVQAFQRERGRITRVLTSQGPRQGCEVLLALGAWSPHLADTLDVRIPVQPGKGYSITTDRPALSPRRPLVLRDYSVCVTSWGSGYRLGSTMEFSGYDDRLNPVRLDALERAARACLHTPMGAFRQESWCGWRPMSADELPLLGRAPGHDNLWLATGHGMLGISMSAGTGQLLADLITRRAPQLDPAPYSPSRF